MRATLAQHQERVALLDCEAARTRLESQSRLQENEQALKEARVQVVELRQKLQTLTAALEGAEQATRRQSAAGELAEQEFERLSAELRLAVGRSAKAESDGANFEKQLAERTRELAEVKGQLESAAAMVLASQESCQSRTQETLDLRCLVSTLEKKYATLEKHIRARTREQSRLILALDRQIGRRRDAEAENERFRRETTPAQGAAPVHVVPVEPPEVPLFVARATG